MSPRASSRLIIGPTGRTGGSHRCVRSRWITTGPLAGRGRKRSLAGTAHSTALVHRRRRGKLGTSRRGIARRHVRRRKLSRAHPARGLGPLQRSTHGCSSTSSRALTLPSAVKSPSRAERSCGGGEELCGRRCHRAGRTTASRCAAARSTGLRLVSRNAFPCRLRWNVEEDRGCGVE